MKHCPRKWTNTGILVPSLVIALLVVSGCSTTDTGTTNASTSSFQFPSLKNPWGKTDPKYADLENGPLAGDIGSALSPAARKQALEAEYQALESRKSGETIRWQYSATQNGKITPYPPYQVGSSNCRRYVHAVSIDGQTRQSAGTACRDNEGKWTPLT